MITDERLEEIRRCLNDYKAQMPYVGYLAMRDLLTKVDRLKAENARLREDSKRLDFLEACPTVCLTRVRESECAGTYIDYLIGSRTGEAKRLRQAIDDAMEGKSE